MRSWKQRFPWSRYSSIGVFSQHSLWGVFRYVRSGVKMIEEEIKKRILKGIPGCQVDIVVSGNRAEISVVSESFEELNRVQRDQEVYRYVNDYISDGTLHAVTVNARVQ